jgi:hypothetical protein
MRMGLSAPICTFSSFAWKRVQPVNYRLRLLALSLSGVAILVVVNVGWAALNTLSRFNAVVADLDRWRRPSDAVEGLNPTPGNTVVDLGCGSGHFAPKLPSPVGKTGHVIAEDIRWLPSPFLWVRTILNKEHNVSLIHGKPDDPELPVKPECLAYFEHLSRTG